MVNLIPYNPTASGGFQAPKHQRVERPFMEGEFEGWILVVIFFSWESGNFHRNMMIIDDLIFLSLSCKPLPFQTMGSKLS